MSQRVYTLFQQSVEATMNVGETLAPCIDSASDILVEALLAEKKIFACGNGRSAALANIFTASLLDRHERERPGLPAILLGGGMSAQNCPAQDLHAQDIYAKPLRALAQQGDALVVISASGTSASLGACIDIAHEIGMRVIALTGCDGGDISTVMQAQDLEIHVPLVRSAHIHELHLLSLFSLCDLIDHKIFGME